MSETLNFVTPPNRGALGAPCVRCKENPATHRWGGSLAVSHGWEEHWCERCVVEVQLDHALGRAKRIADLEARLAVLGGPAKSCH